MGMVWCVGMKRGFGGFLAFWGGGEVEGRGSGCEVV